MSCTGLRVLTLYILESDERVDGIVERLVSHLHQQVGVRQGPNGISEDDVKFLLHSTQKSLGCRTVLSCVLLACWIQVWCLVRHRCFKQVSSCIIHAVSKIIDDI